jgi:hypothetical protein
MEKWIERYRCVYTHLGIPELHRTISEGLSVTVDKPWTLRSTSCSWRCVAPGSSWSFACLWLGANWFVGKSAGIQQVLRDSSWWGPQVPNFCWLNLMFDGKYPHTSRFSLWFACLSLDPPVVCRFTRPSNCEYIQHKSQIAQLQPAHVWLAGSNWIVNIQTFVCEYPYLK